MMVYQRHLTPPTIFPWDIFLVIQSPVGALGLVTRILNLKMMIKAARLSLSEA
jgi:hypothetical protein